MYPFHYLQTIVDVTSKHLNQLTHSIENIDRVFLYQLNDGHTTRYRMFEIVYHPLPKGTCHHFVVLKNNNKYYYAHPIKRKQPGSVTFNRKSYILIDISSEQNLLKLFPPKPLKIEE